FDLEIAKGQCTICLLKDCKETWFDTTSRVGQGSVLSPLLFMPYLDLGIREVAADQPHTNALAYVNDIVQLNGNEEDLQHLTKWHTCFKQYGLKINLKKTEVMVLHRIKQVTNIRLDDTVINQVDIFTYLGSVLSSTDLIDTRINTRKRKYSQNVGFMYRLWRIRMCQRK
uniref:ribonuclease H n=1 Tax=Amphiprion percula TaxID=161767 RepID=A0A3P8SK99_AMPPE